MPTAHASDANYTPQQYLQLIHDIGEKWKYFEGQVVKWQAMAGANLVHIGICDNIQGELRNRFIADKIPCKALNSDAMLAIPNESSYRFPVITVQCGEPIFDEVLTNACTNPKVLIEVISASSRRRDYTDKLQQYGNIDSLRDYVIVEQRFPMVTVYSRESSTALRWSTIIYSFAEAQVVFPSLDISIPLAEMYRDLTFEKHSAQLTPCSGLPQWPTSESNDNFMKLEDLAGN